VVVGSDAAGWDGTYGDEYEPAEVVDAVVGSLEAEPGANDGAGG
jgi:hypothetical protein